MTQPARTRRSHSHPAGSALVAVLLALLVAAGCGAAPAPRAAAPTGTPPATPTASGRAASAPPARPSVSPTATATPTRLPRLPRDTTSPATPRQLTGLVRVVAIVHSDGSGRTGTGMVLTAAGEVLTNRHVVVGARSVQVTVVGSGRTYAARVTAGDARHDVALLHLVGASGLATVMLAADDAAVRDRVTVVGDAHGAASRFEAATGTVVALDQTLQTRAEASTPAERLTGLLLDTADVVSGDSGGPTYDAAGQVVGMTTAAVATQDGTDGVAIPVSTLRAVVDRLRSP